MNRKARDGVSIARALALICVRFLWDISDQAYTQLPQEAEEALKVYLEAHRYSHRASWTRSMARPAVKAALVLWRELSKHLP